MHYNDQINFNWRKYEGKIPQWVKNGIDKEAIVFAEAFGKHIKDGGLTTSQIRNVFGEMRRIQLTGFEGQKTAFLMLKPKLAYTVKRHDKEGLRAFFELFKLAFDAVDTANTIDGKVHYENLMNLIEAILAYHKFWGGKE